jgi:hypothetical protein
MNGFAPEFTFQWIPIIIIGALVTLVVLGMVIWLTKKSRREKASERPDALTVWHISKDLKHQETYHAYRRYKLLSTGSMVVCVLALAGVLGLSARPSSVTLDTDTTASRDIVLCLDVSGSDLPFDRQVIAAYKDITTNFKGERIGLNIFNSTSRTVFPLTDDYTVVDQQLSHALNILQGVQNQASIESMSKSEYQQISDWLAGTQNRADATSLIGDGLMSCAAMLPEFSVDASSGTSQAKPQKASGNSASIVFATDNVLSGHPLYTLSQALGLTKASSIRVDGLYAGAASTVNDSTTQDFRNLITSHGGIFVTPQDAGSVTDMVRSIETQQASNEEQEKYNIHDEPLIWVLGFGLLFLVFVILTGRLRR